MNKGKKDNLKRGLVVIYDPHSLQQFLWYYCTYAKNVQWDALCLPNGYKGTYMTVHCKRAGVFANVLSDDTDYMNMPLSEKIRLFLKMLWYFLTFRRTILCKKILNEYVQDIDAYSELACICETGFVSGLFALLGKEKKVSYFDDGLGDYYERRKWSSPYLKSVSIYLQGLILAKMGYGCKGRFYFEPTKYCYKYSVVTEKMLYRNYKEMLDIDFSITDVDLYNSLITNVYPEIQNIDFSGFDAVFFTEDLDTFSPKNYQEYAAKCSEYIGSNYKTVLVKKHPKDLVDYDFGSAVKMQEIDSEIPAELILSFLKGKKIIFSYFSSVIIFMQPYGYGYEIMHIDKLYRENRDSKVCEANYGSLDDIKAFCDRFSPNRYRIIEL